LQGGDEVGALGGAFVIGAKDDVHGRDSLSGFLVGRV
jgi:hypothetical protein